MYRRVPERMRAREQFDHRMVRRLTTLERRVAFPGRSRFERVGSIVTSNSTPSLGVVAISLDIRPGRWKIDSRAQIEPTQNAAFTLIPWAYDENSSAIAELNDVFQLGYARWQSPVAGAFDVPLTAFGVGSWPNGGRVDLQLHVSGGTPSLVTWEQVWLIATPI